MSVVVKERAVTLRVEATWEESKALCAAFSYQHPSAERILSHQLWLSTTGEQGWDGSLNPFDYIKGEPAMLLNRGHLDELVVKLEKLQMPFKLELLPRPFEGCTVDDIPDDLITAEFALDHGQRNSIAMWLTHAIGINKMAVNSGKTATFAGAVAMVKTRFPKARFVYITASERLVRQAFTDLTGFLPDLHITQYGGGKQDNTGRDVVVCTLAMLRKHHQALKSGGWLKTFMGVLVDESHHAASESFQQVLKSIPAYFRFGASDSLKAEDIIASTTIRGLLGPVRSVVAATRLMDEGRSARPHIYLVDIHEWKNRFAKVPLEARKNSLAWAWFEGNPDPVRGVYEGPLIEVDAKGNPVFVDKPMVVDAVIVDERVVEEQRIVMQKVPKKVPGWHLISVAGKVHEVASVDCLLERSYDRAIIRFEERNKLIVEWAQHFSKQGKPTVVVATRTTHVLLLESMLAAALGADKVKSLYSVHSSSVRDAAFKWLREEPGAVLVSPLVKEGVSINSIRAIIVADVVADWEVANQIIGRGVRRKEEGNKCEIVWFVDRQHPRYSKNAIQVMDKLQAIKGFVYYHPCSSPDVLHQALVYGNPSDE